MIKIALIEGQNVMRNGIRSLLNREDDIEVIAETAATADVLSLLKSGLQPDILLTSMDGADDNELAQLKTLRRNFPSVKIIILSILKSEKNFAETVRAGAKGYILKTASEEELVFGIKQVYNSNKFYLCSELGMRLLQKLLRTSQTQFDVQIDDLKISNQDVQILTLLSEGFNNQEIADKLFTSKRTIEGHRQVLISKTGTRNTAALMRFALLNNIIQ